MSTEDLRFEKIHRSEVKTLLDQCGEELQTRKEQLDSAQPPRCRPEHFRFGVWEMNLFDLVETLCRWAASGQAHPRGPIGHVNDMASSFGMPNALRMILLNTVQTLNPPEKVESPPRKLAAQTASPGKSRPLPPLRNCPYCYQLDLKLVDLRFYECNNCGARGPALPEDFEGDAEESQLRATVLWNNRFDGQYGITASQLHDTILDSISHFAYSHRVEFPHLQSANRHPLEQIITGCLLTLHLKDS